MDGIQGKEPDAQLSQTSAYSTGWLHGCEDREQGIQARDVLAPSRLKKGDTVTIPKGTRIHSTKEGGFKTAGRTYKVKLHDVYPGTPAYIDIGARYGVPGAFIRPSQGEILWAGAGGYWCRADLEAIESVNTPKED